MKERIKQFESRSGNLFRKSFIEKYNMEVYTDINQPVVFLGCYFDYMLRKIIQHKAYGIAIWRGIDITWAQRHRPDELKQIRDKKNIRHIAVSNFIEQALDKSGFEYKSIPIVPMNNEDIKPRSLGNKIYSYNANSVKYGGDIFELVKARLPNHEFIVCNHKSYAREELLKVYESCFLGVRFTKHDGLSNTAVELGLMGRKIIWNGNTPNAIPYDINNLDEIVNIIQDEYERRDKSKYQDIARKVADYIDITNDFLYVPDDY